MVAKRTSFIRHRLNRRGLSLLEVIVSSAIAALGVAGLCMAVGASGRQRAELRNSVTAEALASELLEFFSSRTTLQLKAYLSKNPVNGSAAPAKLYKLCSHINLLDRDSHTVLNLDPLATLPVSPLDPNGGGANRFYMVQVIDATTLTVRSDLCAFSAAEIYFPGQSPPPGTPPARVLGPNHRFFVTVGVNWLPKAGLKFSDEKRVVLTALVAN